MSLNLLLACQVRSQVRAGLALKNFLNVSDETIVSVILADCNFWTDIHTSVFKGINMSQFKILCKESNIIERLHVSFHIVHTLHNRVVILFL